MAEYSSAQILAMQRDAINRVNEMQRRAKSHLGDTASENREIQFEQGANAEATKTTEAEAPNNHTVSSPIGSLDSIMEWLTGERIILLLMIYIMITEKADNTLIIALVYILL